MWQLLHYVPKNHLSWLVGKLVELEWPRILAQPIVCTVAKLLKLNEAESELPFSSYNSIQKLFTRKLKPGTRPIQAALVSPVDAELRIHAPVSNSNVMLVKGKNYSLFELVAGGLSEQELENLSQGYAFNFYLAPKDYHHVHAPCDIQIKKLIYIPGKLWPVNDWAVENIGNLFAVNERVAICFESQFGAGVLVMVGACNVGKMTLAIHDLITNQLSAFKTPQIYNFAEPIKVAAGGLLGTFNLGSSVVLVLGEPQLKAKLSSLELPRTVKMGMQL